MGTGHAWLLKAGLFAVAVALAIAAAIVLYPTDPASRIVVTLAIAVGFVVKLGLRQAPDDHRRVLAVLAYLKGSEAA